MDEVLFEKENGVGWVTLNRPQSRNALSMALMTRLRDLLEEVSGDREVRVVVIRGNGPVFCAGHDIREMKGEDREIHDFRRIFRTCTELMEFIHEMAPPVIAQVHGIATAAGCQLVAACDLAIAEEEARFATPGVKIGLFCSTPMVPLARVIGRRRALEMLLSGRFVSAPEALDFGLVNRVVPPESLQKETGAWAAELARFSRFTMAFGKRAFYAQIDSSEREAYAYAQEAIAVNCLDADAQEGMAAFLEKRQPEWKDRGPKK
jgi:enoyl-CoA hydratase/carnithine racemase